MSSLPNVGNHQQCDYRRHRVTARELAEILGEKFGWKVKPESLEIEFWEHACEIRTLALEKLPGFSLEFEGFQIHPAESCTLRRPSACCSEDPWAEPTDPEERERIGLRL